MSRIPNVARYSEEPYTYNNIRTALKFLEKDLKPLVFDVQRLLNTKSREEWSSLTRISPNHPHIKALRLALGKVKAKWNTRPRFPEDEGRVSNESY